MTSRLPIEAIKQLTCYRTKKPAVEIRPGRSNRDWMDATDQRFAYRCLPLTIANCYGWELILPADVTAEWNGGSGLADITLSVDHADWNGDRLACSHFGHGVLTFHVGYLFRTEPGVALMVRGAPNWPRPDIYPLEGLVETDWLPFTFTMNWAFTRPSRVVFKAGEPFCFITPVRLGSLETLQPEIIDLNDCPKEADRFAVWSAERSDFNARLKNKEPAAAEQGWQKWYTRGVHTDGTPAQSHVSKLKLMSPLLKSD
jgi:Family of unknown function (DUF6065)